MRVAKRKKRPGLRELIDSNNKRHLVLVIEICPYCGQRMDIEKGIQVMQNTCTVCGYTEPFIEYRDD